MKRTFFVIVALLFFPVLIAATSSRYSNVEAASFRQDTPTLNGLNIYFTEAGKEASRFDRSDEGLSRFAGLLSQLGANLYTLEWRTAFPTDADLIIVAGPQADLTPDQIARLWAYMNNGGHLLLLAEPITGIYKALPVNSGLFQLTWTDMGIRARNDVVVTKGDTSTPDATPEAGAPASNGLIASFTTTNINATHPITTGFSDELVFNVARSIEYDASIQNYTVTPLVSTDNNFYGESAYDAYLKNGTAEFNIGADTTQGSLALAVAFENPKTNSRFVVIGDRQFATNGGGLLTSPANSSGFIHPGNAQFLVNCVTWLLARATVKETFPTPGPTATATLTPTITPTPSPTLEQTATPTATK